MIIKIMLGSMSLLVLGCRSQQLPTKRLMQYNYHRNITYKSDTLTIELGNPLKCPLRVFLSSKDSVINVRFKAINPILISPISDTILKFRAKGLNNQIQFSSLLGDPNKKIIQQEIALPFKTGKAYKIIQGYNGKTSHYSSYSRYAIDFSLQQKDTIHASTNGYVVGVVNDYKNGGWDKKWEPYANFITIYNPETGVFTQYGHLYYKGSFVKLGDQVEMNQPIGLAGLTGMTNIEHLHFNSLIPVNNSDGLQSIPVLFKNNFHGKDFKIGQIIKK